MANSLSPSSTVAVDELAESLSQATLGLECKQFTTRSTPRRVIRAGVRATVKAAPIAAPTSESTVSTFPLLDAIGLDLSHFEPLSLLSALSELVMPKALFIAVLDELDIALESQESKFKVIMLGIAKQIREPCENGNDKMWDDKIKQKLLLGDSPLLQDLVSMTDFHILMIGENPTSSSALGVIGVRKSTINLRATGLKDFDVPFGQALDVHLGRLGKDKFRKEETEEHRTLLSIKERNTSNEIDSSPPLTIFDAAYPNHYQRPDHLYDIVFGHCLYPPTYEKNETKREREVYELHHHVLAAVKAGTILRERSKPVLVILTTPVSPHYAPRYQLARLIDASKGDYQYLGANRFIEQNILKFGYRHERRMDSFYVDIHRFHDGLKDDLRAHVFLLKRRGL